MQTTCHPKTKGAFTLIELLIVVAIIAILAAIAVPNFLEAQVRSKVSATKSNMRALATAIESYYVDNNAWMPGWGTQVNAADPNSFGLFLLSTPIAYFSSGDVQDIFVNQQSSSAMYTTLQYDPMTNDGRMFSAFNIELGYIGASERPGWWCLFSNGPDLKSGFGDWMPTSAPTADDPESNVQVRVAQADTDFDAFLVAVYDPTNGTISMGNLWRAGGGSPNAAGRHMMK